MGFERGMRAPGGVKMRCRDDEFLSWLTFWFDEVHPFVDAKVVDANGEFNIIFLVPQSYPNLAPR